jgi:hypothetical protein
MTKNLKYTYFTPYLHEFYTSVYPVAREVAFKRKNIYARADCMLYINIMPGSVALASQW